MTKNVKIILGVIAGIIGVFVGYLTVTSVISNISNNRQQEQVNLKVEDNSNNKKNTGKKSGKNSGKSTESTKQSSSDSSSDKESGKSASENDTSLIKTPANSDYQYDANAPRELSSVEPVKSDDYYSDKVKDLSRGSVNDDKASADERAAFNNYWNEIVASMNQLKDMNVQAVTQESAMLTQEIYSKYLGTTDSARRIVDAYTFLDINNDANELHLSSPSGSLSRFSLIIYGKDGQQYMYITGFYNKDTNSLRSVASTYLKDGAVARDKINISRKSIQTAN